jgi:anti-sigma factor RsiW
VTCDFRDSVAARILGGLPPLEALRVDEHVVTCDECAAHQRELAVVRTMLDTLDRTAFEPAAAAVAAAAAPGPAEIAAVTSIRQRRSRPDLRSVLLGAAAALVVGVLPVGVWALTHRDDGARSIELAGTSVTPDSWATVRLLPRTEGTIVDVEAGDLPTTGGRYAVTVAGPAGVLARQEFTVDPDGWAQVVLATSEPVRAGDSVTVERVDGSSPVTVLSCDCRI